MKIAVLSLILNTNYGGILQSYALQTVLERMGHRVKVIDRCSVPDISIRQYVTVMPKRIVQKYIMRKKMRLWPEQHYQHQRYLQRSSETSKFIFRNIHIRKTNVLNRIRKNEFDAFVVGSDQVWRPKYFICWGDIRDAYLSFTKGWNVRRLSYAAGYGTDEWEYTTQQTVECSKLAKMFNAISVREQEGVRLCRKKLGAEAIYVLDPTLLLDREDYENLISQAEATTANGTLLNYILDDNKEKTALVNRISEEKLVPFRINETEDCNNQVCRKSVEMWLRAFRDADFMVTDSFHACVFSLIFNKPFVCVGNKERGLSRFSIFIKDLGMDKNILMNTDEYDSAHDYSPNKSSYDKLSILRQKSVDFIKTNLQ